MVSMKQTTKTRRPALPARLRAARIRAGLTVTETAVAVGFTREHVSRFENERRWSPELAFKLARLFDIPVNPDDLFPEDSP
jgi:DNA-binding XRE family transcriptional regulator